MGFLLYYIILLGFFTYAAYFNTVYGYIDVCGYYWFTTSFEYLARNIHIGRGSRHVNSARRLMAMLADVRK